jgi:polyhydroxyalkanoate synthesis regulator phasin
VAEPARDEPDLVEEVREKAGELARLLDTFSQRLRRMREQNKQVQGEIDSFEGDLDRLRRWLREHT